MATSIEDTQVPTETNAEADNAEQEADPAQ